jgi:glycosyltransferase involved in cell wall biosynthesis
MKILIVNNTTIPALKYGGTERVVWSLGKELNKAGHQVTFLVGKKSVCPFAKILIYNPEIDINDQIPEDTDLVHSFIPFSTTPKKPYIITVEGNGQAFEEFDINTVFVSRNHAERHSSQSFVYNGLDPEDYGKVNWLKSREHLLFLGKASRKEKNVKDCKFLAQVTEQKLAILGGWGFSFSKYISYKGMVGGEKKNRLLNQGKALLFPIRWHEPFGIALTESMYFGNPVIGTTYGSLPELITPETGVLTNSLSDMAEAIGNIGSYDRKKIHQYVMDNFSSKKMMNDYFYLYEKVLNGEKINPHKPKSILTEKAPLLDIYD